MRSVDVKTLYELVGTGAQVVVTEGHLKETGL
jgi:lipoprotein-anchoring transpeptidase ErfK/SrfK